MRKLLFTIFLLFFSCSPIKSLPEGEKHQKEIHFHQMQTNIDEMHHDVHCFKTQIEILDKKNFFFNPRTLIWVDKQGIDFWSVTFFLFNYDLFHHWFPILDQTVNLG